MLIDIFTYSASTAHGVFGVEELIEAARRAHLDGIGITDRAVSYTHLTLPTILLV